MSVGAAMAAPSMIGVYTHKFFNKFTYLKKLIIQVKYLKNKQVNNMKPIIYALFLVKHKY